MSLYGGISFKGKEASPVTPAADTNAPPTTVAAPEASSSAPPDKVDDKPKPAAWSAALRFAPTIRKKPTAPSTPAAFRSAFASVEDTNVNKGTRLVGKAKPALSSTPASVNASATPPLTPSPAVSASPVPPPSASTAAPPPTTTAPPRIGRILKPPSMTLDEDDVNGFKGTAAGQKAANAAKKRNKKGRKSGAPRDDPGLAYTEVKYDPARPCDYAGYKAHLLAQRERRRAEREEERRRRDRSYSGSSYSGSSDEERSDNDDRNPKKARFFAPPSSYNEPASEITPIVDEKPNPNSAPKGETGEEAYLRRLAMSSGGAASRPSQPAPPPPPAQPSYPSFAPATSTSTSISAAPTFYPSSTSSPAPPPPSFVSSSGPSFASYGQPPPPPPGFVPPPFMPASESSATPPNADSTDPIAIAQSAAAAKAREIAQRLSKLAGLQPPPAAPEPTPAPAEPTEPDDRPFAQRMMAKFGYKEGQGLGASEDGITTALSVSKAASNSKKGKNKKEEEPVQAGMAGKSRTVDSTREQRLKDQNAQYGEPSRVVVLTNLCGREDVDDDLSGEVAEEATKFGVVERCFVYLVPGEERDNEAVRIFLVMSGLAGGYNAVKNFDGRFFGGRTVSARFYDEPTFRQGYYVA